MSRGEPVLAATLIVRNEERVLGDCLASLRPVVDEIVVVDTGSSDRSAELAAEHGARVFRFAWCDDFSAARNCAIDHATAPWLLYIDADERVSPGDHERVRAALTDPGAVSATVRFHPRTGFTAYPEYRLYRRDPRLRFEGVVHETMLPSVFRLIEEDGATLLETDLAIEHVGYDGPQTHKAERYVGLLSKATKRDPERVYLWWHLGCIESELGHVAAAETHWRHGAALAVAQRLRNSDALLCHNALVNLELQRGGDPSILIAEARGLRPDNHLLQRLEAMWLTRIGRHDEAVRILERHAAIDPDTLVADNAYDKRLFGAGAAADAAECAFLGGDFAAAARWWAVAEKASPNSVELRTKRRLAEQRARAASTRPAETP